MTARSQDAPRPGAASRRTGVDSLQFFPTPSWATRALCEMLAREFPIGRQTAWEPTAGEGDMVRGLWDYFRQVIATDVHDYGAGYGTCDFLTPCPRATRAARRRPPHWIVMNPPFSFGHEFALRALDLARVGVAVFEQLTFLESVTRYHALHAPHPMWRFCPFVERVPIFEGRVDEGGSSNKAYAWFVWAKGRAPEPVFFIPPGTRAALERPGDYG